MFTRNASASKTAKTLALGALLGLAAASSFAAGSTGSPEQVYQRVVGGQSAGFGNTAPATSSNVRVEEQLVPGPRAAYAIHTGVAKDVAIAQARAVGEFPTRQVVKITSRQLTPAEKWERRNSGVSTSFEKVEVISSEQDRGPAGLATGSKASAI
ncbi:MAG TPA: hypothetical protein VLA61_03915 [Ideonella sp.]|uniref:hypothetical protein n=1 Tax=Ideonella sp. TaxID=1929293 RepID=UPI002B7B3F94|nr:hypothetical protein [Ideonella sp.]HSI47387.1 hypothetical protein [Ideonella sp.]